MEQLLANINTGISQFSSMMAQAIARINTKRAELTALQEQLKLVKQNLDTRQQAIEKVESVAALAERTSAQLAEIKNLSDRIAIEKSAFNDLALKRKKELDIQAAEVANVKARNLSDSKALTKARKELEADKESYKLKMAQSIVKGVK